MVNEEREHRITCHISMQEEGLVLEHSSAAARDKAFW